ncbi:MAG TPA: hypothetical protein ENJ80_05080 [Gammaproteobacteria bacterium]|nr:hypothetical protein [Gammaproteobacteria bacterium]
MSGAAHHESLHHLAYGDMAKRSRASGLVYLTLYVIIFLFTPYSEDHPAVMLPAGGAILLLVAVRTWLIYRFDGIYPPKPGQWLNGFMACTLLLAAVWGGMSAFAVHFYALEWTSMLILLSTAGISAGAITTLSIHRRLILASLALLLLPATITTATLQTREALAITLMFITYCGFMLGIAIRVNKEYWHALNNAILLDQRARQLESSNQELESYSYSIAHDLRTPLRSIIGFSQILMESAHDKFSENERSDLKRVITAGKHMAELIDDILELSRISRKDLASRQTDLSNLASTHAQLLASQAPERSVSFNIEPGLSASGDPKLLGIALQNLLDNAWKFTSNRDNAEISLRASQVDNETVYSLCDNGVGFDMAYAEMLFKPFYRLHNGTEFPGTGVGLATVERIILRHGGRIWAEAETGKGTCVHFTLRK